MQVRPFRRSDRERLTQLVNTHAAAVVPGMSVSVSTVLSALERQPGEFVEDPWVAERVTLAAEQADRGRRRCPSAAVLLRRASRDSGSGCQRHPLVLVLARGSGRESLLAGRDASC
jgi:hypothetical protein